MIWYDNELTSLPSSVWIKISSSQCVNDPSWAYNFPASNPSTIVGILYFLMIGVKSFLSVIMKSKSLLSRFLAPQFRASHLPAGSSGCWHLSHHIHYEVRRETVLLMSGCCHSPVMAALNMPARVQPPHQHLRADWSPTLGSSQIIVFWFQDWCLDQVNSVAVII